MRAAAPRIQARQLLCIEAGLSESIRSLASVADNSIDLQIAHFVADASDMMRVLAAKRTSLARGEADMTSIDDLTRMMYSLAHETGVRLDHCNTLPRLRRVALSRHPTTEWPASATRTTVLVSDSIWATRIWITYHMCHLTIMDRLLQSQGHGMSPDCHEDGLDATTSGLHTPSLLSALNASIDYLLDVVPFLTGLIDIYGKPGVGQPNDTGLLIAQYPLWTIEHSLSAKQNAKHEASQLQRFIVRQRRLL